MWSINVVELQDTRVGLIINGQKWNLFNIFDSKWQSLGSCFIRQILKYPAKIAFELFNLYFSSKLSKETTKLCTSFEGAQ